MKKALFRMIRDSRRTLKLCLAVVFLFSCVTFTFGSVRGEESPEYDESKNAPSYGLLSAISFQDAGMNYLGGIALDGAGKVWTWGWNQHGQLGINKGYGINSTNPDRLGYAGGMIRVPYFVDNDINVIQVSAGYHFNMALDDQGNVYAWGHNNNQQTGQTTNTTTPSGVGRIEPAKVEGLPKIQRIAANNGYLDHNIGIALDVDGDLWIWGSNKGGAHGQGNTTVTAAYQATPHKVTFPEEITIVDFCAGGWTVAEGAFVHVLDSDGNRWSWGRNVNGTLGLGPTASSDNTTPIKATPTPGMGKLLQISSSYRATIALDEFGQIWQWGQIYGGTNATSNTTYGTPTKVNIDPSEITRMGYTPIPQSVTAGERTYYFIDQYGRPWAWGSGTYYGFGREGGYTVSSSQYTPVAQQYPRVMGDGDTQASDGSAKAPPAKTPSGRGNYGFNDLHPTIYDKKYENNPTEDVWKKLAFQPIPKLTRIFAARSTYMLLDEDGNIYRWGLDGSGSVAWGWDYDSKYDTTGNAKDGLYDKYTYEVMYMRGSPSIAPLTISFSKSTAKIYKGVTTPGTDEVTVNLTIPANVVSQQMNISFGCEVREIKAVIIPADPSNPDFQIDAPTREQFDAAYANVLYQTEDLLTGAPITSQSTVTTVAETLSVSDNCKVWVLVNDSAYYKPTDTIRVYTADNFYTPMDLYQKGEKKYPIPLDPENTLYDMEQDKVEKVYPTMYDLNQFGMDTSQYVDKNPDVYGLPLYSDGTVIPDPSFGFDEVKITALDVAGYALSKTMPGELGDQHNPVTYTLDEAYALAGNTHTFFFVVDLPNKSAYINGALKPNNGLEEAPVQVELNDKILYQITVENKASSVTVVDKVPEGLTVDESLISPGGSYDGASREITWEDMTDTSGEITVSFVAKVVSAGVFENTAEVTYSDSESAETNTTWHRYMPPHEVNEEFYEFNPVTPYKGAKLQESNTVSVNHGASYYRGGTPPAAIDKDGVHYIYYGVVVDGVFDGQALNDLPARLIDSVENDGVVVTYLYERSVWTVTDQFREFVVSTALKDDNEVAVGDNLPYNPAAGTPPSTITESGRTYTYYGYQIDGVFFDATPPADPMGLIKTDRIITYLYRTEYLISEMFKTSPAEPGDPDLAPKKVNGAVPPATPSTIWSGDSFFPDTPPETLIYGGYFWEYAGYMLNGGTLIEETQAEFIGVSDDYILKYMYEKGAPTVRTLHLRQVVLDRGDSTAELPYMGYFNLKNGDGVTYNVSAPSNKAGANVPFRSVLLPLGSYWIKTMIPQHYMYAGYRASEFYEDHDEPDLLTVTNPFLLDYSDTTEWWVTVFLKPLERTPDLYAWDARLNDFGVIYAE